MRLSRCERRRTRRCSRPGPHMAFMGFQAHRAAPAAELGRSADEEHFPSGGGRLIRIVWLLAFAVVANDVVPAAPDSETEAATHRPGQGRQQVPSALTADDCDAAAPENELPKDRFIRKGGRSSKAEVRRKDGLLTVDGIEQGRNIDQYDRGHSTSKGGPTRQYKTRSRVPRQVRRC